MIIDQLRHFFIHFIHSPLLLLEVVVVNEGKIRVKYRLLTGERAMNEDVRIASTFQAVT